MKVPAKLAVNMPKHVLDVLSANYKTLKFGKRTVPMPVERKRGLPSDLEGKNPERAAWALSAVRLFQEITGSDNDTAVGDLLADIMHMCDRFPEMGPFDQQLENGLRHYEAETTEQ